MTLTREEIEKLTWPLMNDEAGRKRGELTKLFSTLSNSVSLNVLRHTIRDQELGAALIEFFVHKLEVLNGRPTEDIEFQELIKDEFEIKRAELGLIYSAASNSLNLNTKQKRISNVDLSKAVQNMYVNRIILLYPEVLENVKQIREERKKNLAKASSQEQ